MSPDVTMCKDHECPSKQDCYRYMARANEYRQSYFVGSPRENDGSCNHFMEIWEKPKKSEDNENE